MSNRSFSEAETLEQYGISLDNAIDQPQIAEIMSEFGYDTEEINQGKVMLTETRSLYDTKETESDEASEAYDNYAKFKNQLQTKYKLHRKKAKVVFRNDLLIMDKLNVSGILPKGYIKWIETVRKFYSEVSADSEIQTRLSRLKVTPEQLTEAQNLITEVENARKVYMKEKGESQNATQEKDQAFEKLDDWMSEFYAVAKIALEDHPQLLESLGKLVRN